MKEWLPHLNACWNALSALCLAGGYLAVRAKRIALHRGLMLAAFGFSACFLATYITKHFVLGHAEFQGPREVRVVYLAILVSHTLLAVPVLPLSVTLLILALRGRIERHRRLARWTLPVWFYVSVTGVVVYGMLYHLYPPP
jgi:uncharacterized membrane protein YozB (DUF420 family)